VPSQKQVKWSQLKVGITVVVASAALITLIFLMNSTGGVFTKKVRLRSYFDDASGLRQGAPVRLEGVDIGNVASVTVVPDRPMTPVQVVMKVNTNYLFNLHKDSVTSLETAGVLGETFVQIYSHTAKGPIVQDGDELGTRDTPEISDVVRASQGTLQNLDALLKRVDRIVAFVESGQGSIGKVIYDPTLYNRLASTVNEFQSIVDQINNGKGTIGQLIHSDELYQKINTAADKLNTIADDLNQGKGTAGKFLKDPTLYNNANATIANVKKLTDDIDAGKGSLGKLAKDEELARKLDNIITKLSAISDRLDAGEGTAGRLLKDPSLFNNTDQMLIEARGLIKAIRENPKRYLTIRLRVF
jgi:phospholipid/cholesterol/gamma-HCH transport system substrate-binding protein